MNELSTPSLILQYLGGRHFTTMVGAKNLIAIENGNGLQLDFMRNASKANRLRIVYNVGTDLFTMQFLKKGIAVTTKACLKYSPDELRKKIEPTVIEEYEDCYFDDLRRIFERVTKLRTSLTHIYA